VLVAPGTYGENVSITSKVVIHGAGSGAGAGDSIVTALNPSLPVFLVTDAGGTGTADRLTLRDLRITGGADGIRINSTTGTHQWYRVENVAAVNNTGSGLALAGVAALGEVAVHNCQLSTNGIYGLHVADTLTTFATLAVTGGSMDANGANGLAINGTDANLISPTGISVSGTSFAANGDTISNGTGDLSFFLFNGAAAITNVTIQADGHFPIQFRGKGDANPANWSPADSIHLQDVTVSGTTVRPGLYIVRYSDVANVSFGNVDLRGLVPPAIPSGFASVMQVIHSGATPLNLAGLKLKATALTGPAPLYGALAMLGAGGAVADCSTIIEGATTVTELEAVVYDQQDNVVVGDVVFPTLAVQCNDGNPTLVVECAGGGATVNYPTPTYTADCGLAILDSQPASGSLFPVGDTVVTTTIVDNRGITNTCTFTVTVQDTAAPELAGLPPVTENYQCYGEVPAPPTVTASDVCDGALVVDFVQIETNPGSSCSNVITRTWTATDAATNVATFTQTITVNDTTDPIVTAGTIAAGYTSVALAEAAALAATTAADNCGTVNLTASTVGTCSATITVIGTDSCGNSAQVVYNTRIDDVPPTISGITATQIQPDVVGVVDVKDCVNAAVQGVVNFAITAYDTNCTLAAPPLLTLTNGVNSDTAVYVNESPAGTFHYTWTVGVSTPTGTWTATATADDLANTTVSNFTVCVDTAQITGLVEMQGFSGAGTVPLFTRSVTFVATTNDVVHGTNVLKTWVVALTNVGSTNTFAYTLTGVPLNANGLSAKTDWSLREKVSLALDPNGQGVADFVGDGTPGWNDTTDHYLRGGDIGDSLLFPASFNRVLTDDYFKIVGGWLGSDPAVDITGDGVVNAIDYSILAENWMAVGDPQ
jgi:hypothetical protein